MLGSKQMSDHDSSWRQRSELEAIVDLSPELDMEMDRLDKEFWVSGEKLKEIVERFREELEEGSLPRNCTYVSQN
jgi:hexokinase